MLSLNAAIRALWLAADGGAPAAALKSRVSPATKSESLLRQRRDVHRELPEGHRLGVGTPREARLGHTLQHAAGGGSLRGQFLQERRAHVDVSLLNGAQTSFAPTGGVGSATFV